MAPDIRVYEDATSTAAACALALAERIVAAQREGREPRIVLTGGSMGGAVLAALSPATAPEGPLAQVDWSRVHLWWGDERFLPSGDPERNETQAREALLDALPVPLQVHPMPASDGPDGDDLAAAAAAHAAEWDAEGQTPDVVLLGVGPDSHVASLFPHHQGLTDDSASVIAVDGSPKPPPRRISLAMPTIQSARSVWLVAAGEGKAEAVAGSLAATADSADHPAAQARGAQETVWWLDRAAHSLAN